MAYEIARAARLGHRITTLPMAPTDLIALLDKARASLTSKAGDYKYGNPMDQHFFAFTGIAQDALLEQVKTGAGDWALLVWVNANASPKRAPTCRPSWTSSTPTTT